MKKGVWSEVREGHRLGAETDNIEYWGEASLEPGFGTELEPEIGYKRLRPKYMGQRSEFESQDHGLDRIKFVS